MNNLFQKTSSQWVRYSEYVLKQADDGLLYVTPAPKSKPDVYDPLKEAETLVLDMLNVGRLCMNPANADKIKTAVMEFVGKYGLLGFMTALPTTPRFMDYASVYLPTNHFMKAESLSTEEYMAHFFPFGKLDISKKGIESIWNVNSDRETLALAMTFGNGPAAVSMSFQREYAERYDWLVTQLQDWAFTFVTSFLYYEDYDNIDETTREMYRQGMAAFGGVAPTYHIALRDTPTIVWDFHSLMLCVQMMFSFALTDETKPLRMCKHCTKVFAAAHPNAVFCGPRCKNQYNVYKSRGKKE